MKILVFGSRGLLGHHLLPFLQKKGHEVLASPPRTEQNPDWSVSSVFEELCDSIRPDAILNLAALTSVDHCERFPAEAFRLNVDLPRLMGQWQQKRSPQTWLVHLSTDMVYDHPGENPEDRIRLINTYALTKRAGELALGEGRHLVLRTNFFGRSRHPQRKSFSDWIWESINKRESLVLFEDILFSPLSLETLSESIATVFERPQSGIFNLGSRDGFSKAQFALELAKQWDHDLLKQARLGSSRDSTLTAPRPREMKMKVDLFEKTFDFKLPSLAEEIHKTGRTYEKPL